MGKKSEDERATRPPPRLTHQATAFGLDVVGRALVVDEATDQGPATHIARDSERRPSEASELHRRR